jgi:predicted metal-binding membrane protein
MLVLLLLGMMNLAWMGLISGVIFLEKVAPKGNVIGKVVGLGLLGLGIALLATPHPLPAIIDVSRGIFPAT